MCGVKQVQRVWGPLPLTPVGSSDRHKDVTTSLGGRAQIERQVGFRSGLSPQKRKRVKGTDPCRPRGCPSTSPTTWSWSTGPDGGCATTSAGPSPRMCRRSCSGSASPEPLGCSWPRTSRPTSAPGSVKPSTSSGFAREVVSAGREASAPVGGCFPAEHPQLFPRKFVTIPDRESGGSGSPWSVSRPTLSILPIGLLCPPFFRVGIAESP